MKNFNVLQISTYPIVRPLHGGQIRVSQIRKKLIELGANVKSISFSEPSHLNFSSDDFVLDPVELARQVKAPFSNDLATSYLLTKNDKCKSFLVNSIIDFNPDYIFIEQGWGWPLIKSLLECNEINSKVVYSSHNVESVTKKSLFEANDIIDEHNVVASIQELELDLVTNADLIICCTEEDKEYYAAYTDKKILVLPNGVEKRVASPEMLSKIEKALHSRKFALFVGSAYPPNAQGFWDVLGNTMAWLKPDELIVSVGGVSNILENFMPPEANINAIVNFDRIKRLGFVDEDELAALLDLASVIVLPITSGGGSNLKTAEAILSCKPVVATKMACRGFNAVKDYSNFSICEPGNEFVNEVKRYLREAPKNIPAAELVSRKSVTWSDSLVQLESLFD